MAKTNRRSFLGKGATAAVAATAAGGAVDAQPATGKKVWWPNGKVPAKTPAFSPTVSYGNLLFLSGVGAHFKGDIKAHTKHVLDEIQQRLEAAGSSMDKVLKAQVYLADLKDFKEMTEVFTGRFGPEPPVRTTVAVAGVPGDSLVEIDVIAYI
ncbi:MAG TPA: RidA family protein [Bryobacteraceae bacterium]|jgi:enamine deaminase RidA (YjgF/YER057c/UK114 family)